MGMGSALHYPRPMRIPLTLLASAVAAGALVTAPAAMAAPKKLTYKVTVSNKAGSDLTGIVWAVGDRRANLYRLGRRPSNGLALLAEDGVTGNLIAEFRAAKGRRAVGVGPRVRAGRSSTFRVTTTTRHRRLSLASMAVCSNDTIMGINKVALPLKRGRKNRRVVRVRAIDAGSEKNTEAARDVPCLGAHFAGPSENGKVRFSRGIRGNADLSAATHGWGRYIAVVTITRIR